MLRAALEDAGVRVIVPGDDERLIDVVRRAKENGMYVLHDNSQIIVCSVIPVGWRKLGVNVEGHAKQHPTYAPSDLNAAGLAVLVSESAARSGRPDPTH